LNEERPQDVVARGYDAGADAFASWQRQITGSNRIERLDELFALLPDRPHVLASGQERASARPRCWPSGRS